MSQSSLHLSPVKGIKRHENFSRSNMLDLSMELTHDTYSHKELFSEFCPVQSYVDCPPEKVFEYMSDIYCLEEWTYSLRNVQPCEEEGLFRGQDVLGENTDIYCRVHSNKEAMTVDYHCAWDQREELWMIYLNRIVPAQAVLNRRGSVIFWQNCRHPNYDNNPYPESAPTERPAWVGDYWQLFYAGHQIELENLRRILEYRHNNEVNMKPWVH